MKSIRLNNGATRFIYQDNDVLEIIGENLSYELAEYIEENFYSKNDVNKEIEELDKRWAELYDEKKKLKNSIWKYESEIELLKKENERLKNPKPVLTESLNDENELPFC